MVSFVHWLWLMLVVEQPAEDLADQQPPAEHSERAVDHDPLPPAWNHALVSQLPHPTWRRPKPGLLPQTGHQITQGTCAHAHTHTAYVRMRVDHQVTQEAQILLIFCLQRAATCSSLILHQPFTHHLHSSVSERSFSSSRR